MNKKLIAIAALIAAAVAYYFLTQNQNLEAPIEREMTREEVIEQERPDTPTPQEVVKVKEENTKRVETVVNDQKMNRYRKSIAKMSRLLAAPMREQVDHEGFIDLLKEYDLEPIVSDRTDPDLGRQIHIRTKNSLPGTRYLHAKFVTSPDGSTAMAYATYDVIPGEKSLNQAHDEAITMFGAENAKEKVNNQDYRQSELPNCRILWSKRNTADDLKNHPRNAYDLPADVGTIQVMVETDIHCGDDGGHGGHQHAHDTFEPIPEPENR